MSYISAFIAVTSIVLFYFLRPAVKRTSEYNVPKMGNPAFVQEPSLTSVGGPIDDLFPATY